MHDGGVAGRGGRLADDFRIDRLWIRRAEFRELIQRDGTLVVRAFILLSAGKLLLEAADFSASLHVANDAAETVGAVNDSRVVEFYLGSFRCGNFGRDW